VSAASRTRGNFVDRTYRLRLAKQRLLRQPADELHTDSHGNLGRAVALDDRKPDSQVERSIDHEQNILERRSPSGSTGTQPDGAGATRITAALGRSGGDLYSREGKGCVDRLWVFLAARWECRRGSHLLPWSRRGCKSDRRIQLGDQHGRGPDQDKRPGWPALYAEDDAVDAPFCRREARNQNLWRGAVRRSTRVGQRFSVLRRNHEQRDFLRHVIRWRRGRGDCEKVQRARAGIGLRAHHVPQQRHQHAG